MSVWGCKRRCDRNFPTNKEIRKDCKAGCEGQANVSYLSSLDKPERDKGRALELIQGIIGVLRPQPEPEPTPEPKGISPMAWVGIAGGAILLIGGIALLAKKK